MKKSGFQVALKLQTNSIDMSGTEIYQQEQFIPDFVEAVKVKNMLERKAGAEDGFLCRSSAGRIVRLIQNYDSNIYTQEPEELPAQWAFYWSTDPEKALPFVSMATSPYGIGDCCEFEGKIYRSTADNNVWSPSEYPSYWKDVNTDEEQPSEEEPPIEEEPQYPDWKQPSGAQDAYKKGDIVKYNGQLYQSLIDGNVWSPDAYPAGWTLYTE